MRDFKVGDKTNTLIKILNEIRFEREQQNAKWGEQNHSPIEWMGILMEEVGEAAKEATDHHLKSPYTNGIGEIQELAGDNDVVQFVRLENYRKELIQVAAVAVQMIECLDRSDSK